MVEYIHVLLKGKAVWWSTVNPRITKMYGGVPQIHEYLKGKAVYLELHPLQYREPV